MRTILQQMSHWLYPLRFSSFQRWTRASFYSCFLFLKMYWLARITKFAPLLVWVCDRLFSQHSSQRRDTLHPFSHTFLDDKQHILQWNDSCATIWMCFDGYNRYIMVMTEATWTPNGKCLWKTDTFCFHFPLWCPSLYRTRLCQMAAFSCIVRHTFAD